MIMWELIRECKQQSLQNLWTDYLNDYSWIFRVNGTIDYIYAYLHWNWWRYWTMEEEDLTKTSDYTFQTTYNIDYLDEEVIWDNQKYPQRVNLWLPRVAGTNPPNSNNLDYYMILKDLKTIKTTQNYNKLWVHYKRWVIRATDLNSVVDLPDDLLFNAMMFAMWWIQPIFLEQWAQLANNYYAQADKILTNYMQNRGRIFQYDSLWTKC